jgi:hypothetical protein
MASVQSESHVALLIPESHSSEHNSSTETHSSPTSSVFSPQLMALTQLDPSQRSPSGHRSRSGTQPPSTNEVPSAQLIAATHADPFHSCPSAHRSRSGTQPASLSDVPAAQLTLWTHSDPFHSCPPRHRSRSGTHSPAINEVPSAQLTASTHSDPFHSSPSLQGSAPPSSSLAAPAWELPSVLASPWLATGLTHSPETKSYPAGQRSAAGTHSSPRATVPSAHELWPLLQPTALHIGSCSATKPNNQPQWRFTPPW